MSQDIITIWSAIAGGIAGAISSILVIYIINWVRKPKFCIGDSLIEEEWLQSPHSKHIRIPVKAKGGTLNDVQARIEEIVPSSIKISGGRTLFWEREFPHHKTKKPTNPKEVEEHLREYHFCYVAPIDIHFGQTKKVNILVFIEGIDDYFLLANDTLEPIKFNGKCQIKVQFSASNTKLCYKTIKLRIGETYKEVLILQR